MRGGLLGCAALAVLFVLFAPSVGRSQSLFEQLVMPGPLVEGHAKFEADCGKCHVPFSRESQTRLCLDCHKETAADRGARKGFHGRQPDAAKQDCRHCHTDHKGRGADIVQLDRETFNHASTEFALNDAHRNVRCEACHRPKIAWRKAPTACVECHKDASPHKGRIGDKCEGCHGEATWRAVKPYDHAKTKFKLDGAHKDVRCNACHLGEVYRDLSGTCVSCHRLQDVHSDRYGAKCETCHDQAKWKQAHFDHDKTKYRLRGAHVKVGCDDCHKGDLYREKLAVTCVPCHKQDDVHKGQLNARCEQCHNDTDWRKKTDFDHDITRFPLIGLHAVVPCEECHRSQTYKNEPLACAKCHKDKHETRLGANPNCGACHNPNAWARWRYDHARQAKYALTGKHEKVLCEACHATKNPRNLKLATACESCHRKEDPHRGSYGLMCDRCHTTADWRKIAIRH